MISPPINAPIGTKYLLTRRSQRVFVLNRLVFMSALNEIPQPLVKIEGKIGSHYWRHDRWWGWSQQNFCGTALR